MPQSSCHPERKVQARGMCKSCYEHARKKGRLAPLSNEGVCYSEGCEEEVISSSIRAFCDRCRVEGKKVSKKRYNQKTQTKESTRRKALAKKHGITPEEYQTLWLLQGGRCLGCGVSKEILDIDHDHSCCKPQTSCEKCRRGLLCGNCNRALGIVQENPATLRALALYMEAYDDAY